MSVSSLPPAILLMGPTASGKTALAIELYKELPCELISVDSALIYRGMDIGTAKPSAQEQRLAPHALIDILDPADSYSVAQFRQDALRLMQQASEAGKIPLLVGGSMMYYNALVRGLSPLPPSDPEVRRQITQQANECGWEVLHQQLAKCDPQSAKRIHPNDPQRLGRALEVHRISGKSMSHWLAQKSDPIPYQLHQFAIAPQERSVLHQRIAWRFQQMLEQGFEQEVINLKSRGDLHLDLPSMRAVGYRQMWQYLDGEYDCQSMQDKAVAATRQLAKRQLTWLRSWQNVHHLDTFAKDNLTIMLKLSKLRELC